MDLGAKKREITCCFGFPIEIDFLPPAVVAMFLYWDLDLARFHFCQLGEVGTHFRFFFFLIILTNERFKLKLFFFINTDIIIYIV